MSTILIIEDEDALRLTLAERLTLEGLQVLTAANGKAGVRQAQEALPDLILCDILMPEMDGYSVLLALQSDTRTAAIPFIFLTAKADPPQVRAGMELGADDYLCKPFGIDELLARIEAVFRRTKNTTISSNPAFTSGDFEVNFVARQVTINGHEIKLTVKEYLVVSTLALASPKIVTFLSMLQDIWGPEYTDEKQYLHVFIMRLRKKIEEDPQKPQHIISERGVGYRLI